MQSQWERATAEVGGEKVAVPAKAGDVILFDNLVFHGSSPNRSDDVRWALDWRCHASPFADRLCGPNAKATAAEVEATQWWSDRAWWSAPGEGTVVPPWEAWAPWSAAATARL